MEVKEALLKRRSVRKYTDEQVTEEQINELLHAAMSGPSACNKRPWVFYVVTNQEVLAKLNKATRFSNIKSPCSIVVCGNLKKALPVQLADYWIQDCSAATENILLRAVELGLGTVWCGVLPQKTNMKNVSKILELPDHIVPLNIIHVGHPENEVEPADYFNEKSIVRIK